MPGMHPANAFAASKNAALQSVTSLARCSSSGEIGWLFVANARPSRTLLVSLRGRDVAARVRGAISAEELRRRVEVSEY